MYHPTAGSTLGLMNSLEHITSMYIQVVAHNLDNFMLLLDHWFRYKVKVGGYAIPPKVHLEPNTGANINTVATYLEYDNYVWILSVAYYVKTATFNVQLCWIRCSFLCH